MTEFLRQEMELVTDVRAVAAMGMRAYVDRVEEMLGDKLFLIDGMGEALVKFKKVKGWADEEEEDDEVDEEEEEVRDGVADGGEDAFAGGEDEKQHDGEEGGQGPGFAEHHLPGHSSDGVEGEDISPPDAPPGHARGPAVRRPALEDEETGDSRAAVSLTSPHSADGGASLDAGVGLEYDERYHGDDEDDDVDEGVGDRGAGEEAELDGATYSARASRAGEGEGERAGREGGDQGAVGRRPLPPGSPGSRMSSSGLSPGRASAPHTARISLAGLRAAASAAAQDHGDEGESDDDEVMIESPDD